MPTAPIPSNQELIRAGTEAFRAGEYDRAIQILSQVTQAELIPFAQGLALIGRCFTRKGEFRQAADILGRSLRLKDLAITRYYLGECFVQAGDADSAETHLGAALKMDEKLTDAHILLGTLHRQAGRLDEAIRCFNMALRNDPKAIAARFQLAQAAYDAGDLQRATSQAYMIVQQAEDFAPVHVLLGHCALRLNDFRQAAYEYCRVLVHAEPTVEVYEGLGRAFANLRDYDQAIRAFEAVTILQPDHEMAYIAAARLCERTGKTDQAIELWTAVSRFPKYAEMATEALGKLGSAVPPAAATPAKGKKGAKPAAKPAVARSRELPRDFVPPQQLDRSTLPQRVNQSVPTAPLTTHAAGTLSLASRQASTNKTRPIAPVSFEPEATGNDNKIASAFEQLVRPYAEALASMVTRARKSPEPPEQTETIANLIASRKNTQSAPPEEPPARPKPRR